MASLHKSMSRRDIVDDVDISDKPYRKLPNSTTVYLRWWLAQTASHNSCQPRSPTRGTLHCFPAFCSVLIMFLTILFHARGAVALRELNGAMDRGASRSLFPPDSTLFPHVSPGTGPCSQRRDDREELTSQGAAISKPGILLSRPSRPRLDSNTARRGLDGTEISTRITYQSPTVLLPQVSGGAVQLSRVDSDGDSFMAAEERLTSNLDASDFGQPRADQWVCRISTDYGVCSWRAGEGREQGRFCPPNHCCSRSACKDLMCGGGWCIYNNSALCWIKDDHYGGGRCSCQSHGNSCSGNAICHTMQEFDGGTYCTCAQHFLGNGITCTSNPCQSNPCAPGSCSPRGDSYVCDCPSNTHELREEYPQACVAKKNPCITDPCGPPAVVDSCLNFEVDYECICKDGYVSEDGVCEKVDWCKGDPCGPPLAVHDCVSIGMGFKCYCQRGYTRQRDDEGLEYCQKDYCAENPCGSPELVKSCTNRTRRASADTDEDTVAYPRYSCLCSDAAELKVDSETLEGKCVRADPCKGDPCGPPEAVAQCYARGRSYGCTCKAGYTAQPTGANNAEVCVAGDPCVLKVCGPDEFVDSCTTDGKTFTCHCSDEGFLSVEESGNQLCRSKLLCEEHCGPTDAVKQCTPSEGTYECVCKQGYLLAYNKGKRSCLAGDPCAVAPCGSAKAVAECRREVQGYSCICNRGYELRSRPDETQLCAEPQSCVGDPCGPVTAVELCLPGKHTFSCRCREPYVVQEVHGRQRCTMSLNEPAEEETTPPSSTEEKTESQEQPTGLLAGAAIAGGVLVGSAYAGITYFRKRPDTETPESWDAEESPFLDYNVEEAPYTSGNAVPPSEHVGQEAAVLPSASAWG